MSNKSKLTKNPKRGRLHRLKHHPFVVPVLTFITLFIFTLVAFVSFNGSTLGPSDSRVVQVHIDGQTQILPTRAHNVEDLLKRMNIKLGQGDVVEPKLDTEILEDNFSVNIYRARPVTVIDGANKTSVLSAAQSPRGIVRDLGIKLYPEDAVRAVVPEDISGEGVIAEKFEVARSIPVKLVLYGQSYDVRTRAKTVSQLIREKKIKEEDVTVFPVSSTVLTDNAVVFVTYPGKQIITAEEEIPVSEEIVSDPELEAGQTKLREPGSPGKKVVIYEVDKADPNKKVALQTVIAAQPIKRVTAKGTKMISTVTGGKAEWMARAGINPSQYGYVDYIIGRESGWNPASVNGSRCIGLGQKCNASSLIAQCPSWQTDPVCQLQHFTSYANSRYGSWQGAYNAWQVQGWW